MSSNIQVKRVCEHCGKVFTAKTTVTKFCSDDCAKRNYKLRKKKAAIVQSNEETREKIIRPTPVAISKKVSTDQKELINIKVLSAITSIGERTLHRMAKDKGFPKLRIGKLILFHKQTVIQYLIDKYGNL